MWPGEEKEIECFGGPKDGGTMPMPVVFGTSPDVGGFIVHVDDENVPHFYAGDTRVNEETGAQEAILRYVGKTAESVLAMIREQAPDVADDIAENIRNFLERFSSLMEEEEDD